MVFEKVKEIISNHSNVSEDDITLDMSLSDDLEIDSLDAFEIMSEIEDTFDIEIDDDVLEKVKTVNDIVNYLENHVEE